MTTNKDSFITNFSAILWEPGHMGSFLGRLLNDEHIRQKLLRNNNLDYLFKMTPRFEWPWFERTFEVLSYDDFAKYKQLVESFGTNHTDNELTLKIMKLGYLSSKDFFDGYSRSSLLIRYNSSVNYEKFLPELDNIEINNISFPYVKSHLSGLSRINNFDWNKKIVCILPQNKYWIGFFLLFYKHFYYYSFDKTFDLDQDTSSASSFFKQFGENFLSTVDFKFSDFNEIYSNSKQNTFLSRWHYENLIEPEYIVVDIYDLIFNKNYSQLEKISNSPITSSQKELIDQMYSAQNNILEHFGLDHNYEHNAHSDTNYFMNDKIKKIYDNLIYFKLSL
jgi:hypothetical protein